MDTPEIEVARIKSAGDDRVWILLAHNMEARQEALPQGPGRAGIGWRDFPLDGRKRIGFHARPEGFIFGDLILVQRRRQERLVAASGFNL